MEEDGIRHTHSYGGEYAKNALVERFNLTLRKLMETMKEGGDTVERWDCCQRKRVELWAGAAGLAWLEAGSAMLAEPLFSAALWGVTHES
jgi:transposase InsO family protein